MKSRTFRKIIRCEDKCSVALSVRGTQLAIHIRGDNEQAHLTFEQAAKFLDKLYAAMDLILERLGPPAELEGKK